MFIFFCFNVLIAWLFLQNLPIKFELDLGLITIYLLLSLASYYYFVINDLLASRLKGRSMALGFLFAHGAFSFIGFSVIFVIPESIVYYIAGSLLLAAYVFGAYGATRFSRYNSKTRELMRIKSETDELTGLYNRRHFAQINQNLVANSRSLSQTLSVLMFDLDDFKRVNDDLGHAAGDVVLIEIGRIMTKSLRQSDFAYRWGGEEFLLLLPQTTLHNAKQVADKIIQHVAQQVFYFHQHEIKLTISAGIAEYCHEDGHLQQTIRRADQALYQAKQQGKNQAVTAGSAVDTLDLVVNGDTNSV